MEVEEYIGQFEEILNKVSVKNKEEVAVAIMQAVAKDRRMQEIKNERENNNGTLATARQIGYMRKLGLQVPAGLTKAEASKMIDDAVANREN